MYGGNCAALFQIHLLSASQRAHCAFSCMLDIVLTAAVAMLTTAAGVSRMCMKYAQNYVRVLVRENFESTNTLQQTSSLSLLTKATTS